MKKYEVAAVPHCRQFICYENSKLQLLTPTFHSTGLKVVQNADDYSALIPIDNWLRQQFNVIESFVQQNVDRSQSGSSVYKPLWSGDMMYIRMSRWCNVFRRSGEPNRYDSIDMKTPLGKGTFSITIEVPYIYIGPHKNGENFSITLRVTQIVFNPEPIAPLTFHFKEPEPKGRRRKNAASAKEAKA